MIGISDNRKSSDTVTMACTKIKPDVIDSGNCEGRLQCSIPTKGSMTNEGSSFTSHFSSAAVAAACGLPTADVLNPHRIEISSSANSGMYAFALSASDKKHPVSGKPITTGIKLGNLSVTNHGGNDFIAPHTSIPGQSHTTVHPVCDQIPVCDHAEVAGRMAKKAGPLWRDMSVSNIGAGSKQGTTTGPDGEEVRGNWLVAQMGEPDKNGGPPLHDSIWRHCHNLKGALPTGVTAHTDEKDGKSKFIMTPSAFNNLVQVHNNNLQPVTAIGEHGISLTATCIRPPTKATDTHIHVGIKISRNPLFNPDGSHNLAVGQTQILTTHVDKDATVGESEKTDGVDRTKDDRSALYGLPVGSKVNTIKWDGRSVQSKSDVSTKSVPEPSEPDDLTDDEDSD
jgi:hypothetical protein